MIDGLNVADQMIIVALVITADGTKVPVGMVLGDTENSVVVKDLLADLSPVGCATSTGSSLCWTVPRRYVPPLPRCSATGRSFSDAPSTNAETSPATSRSISVTPSTSGWRSRSPSATRSRASRSAGISLPNRQGPPRRRRVATRRARGDVHRCPTRRTERLRVSLTSTNCIESLISRPNHQRASQVLAERNDEQTMDRSIDARSGTIFPPNQRPRRPTVSWLQSTRRSTRRHQRTTLT